MRATVRTITIPIALAAALILSSCAKRSPAVEVAAPMRPIEATAEDKKIIIAKVNGAEITNYACIDMMNRLSAIGQRSATAESREAARKRALDILVLQELALQDAQRQGLRVEDAFVDRTVEQFISKLGHEEGYKEYLAKNHITTVEFRAQVERSLIIQRILTEEVLKKVMVTEVDLIKEYERTKADYVAPETVSVVDITVPCKQGEQAAMKRSQELLAAINADRDKDPSHLVSDATFSVRAVSLDRDAEPALYETARTLRTGELSGVITDGDAVHILKLIEYTPARQRPYEEVKSTIEGTLKTAASIKRRQEWEQELKKDAKIEILDSFVQPGEKKP
jgi:parvulin-like peptidyl-prolyl isomerase